MIKQLFDRILRLEQGETIILNFNSEHEMKSKRTMLFKEKAAYERSCKIVAKGIRIRQHISRLTDTYQLKISCSGTATDWLVKALIEKGGETKELGLLDMKENERIMKLKLKEIENGRELERPN
jgi:hypothetical protein